MSIASPPTRFTPDDLLRLEQGDELYELVDGKLVEKNMSSLANETAGAIVAHLFQFCQQAKSGDKVYPEQTYQCFPHDPDLIRRPDVSLIVASRLSQVPEEGHIPIAPDLVVEVISPNDKIYEFERKLLDYRQAGIRLVCEVNPKFRYIRVHHLNKSMQQLHDTDTLKGEPVIPRFSMAVKDLLQPVG